MTEEPEKRGLLKAVIHKHKGRDTILKHAALIGLIIQITYIFFTMAVDFLFLIERTALTAYQFGISMMVTAILTTILGTIGAFSGNRPVMSGWVTALGILMGAWFIFAYLLPEAGIPPVIPWLYPDMK
ncbi:MULTISPECIES: hypothetical protein [Alteribacter]|uniref:Uncharacterized protein n=1 Tax=Alteribacter keqinensis TaxID=2483800 RepID=A0A3M7TPR2_9BACI|nr:MULTISPECIES: hypothetical protein [Alteribacter]MBM7095264.1 hypothetical protein [Alteribacter salitolerans]RNA67007.1 hypothetical protein EBO34_17605 [Alteribacter keqinensis]